jgi:hypothetical protein
VKTFVKVVSRLLGVLVMDEAETMTWFSHIPVVSLLGTSYLTFRRRGMEPKVRA